MKRFEQSIFQLHSILRIASRLVKQLPNSKAVVVTLVEIKVVVAEEVVETAVVMETAVVAEEVVVVVVVTAMVTVTVLDQLISMIRCGRTCRTKNTDV